MEIAALLLFYGLVFGGIVVLRWWAGADRDQWLGEWKWECAVTDKEHTVDSATRYRDDVRTAHETSSPRVHPPDPVGSVHGSGAGGDASEPDSGGPAPQGPRILGRADTGEAADWLVWVKRCLLSGLAVLLPTVLTLYILWLLFRITGALFAIPVEFVARGVLGTSLGGVPTTVISAAATIGLLLAAGAAAQRLGRTVFYRLEARIFRRLPVARGIHAAVRQLFDLFFAEGAAHRAVGLVEYPRPGMYALCFITSRESWATADNHGVKLVSVYLPTTPNPTSGYLLLVPEGDVVRLDLTVEEAARIIMCGGSIPIGDGRLRLPARGLTAFPGRASRRADGGAL